METYVTKSLSIDVQFHYIYVSSFKLIQLFYKKLTVQELKWGLSNQNQNEKEFLKQKKPTPNNKYIARALHQEKV